MNVTFLKWPVLYYFIWSDAFDEGGYITGQREWHKAAEYGILCENIIVLTIQDNIRNRGDILKFIHTADIHLGAAPDSGMPWAADRGSELWETFYRLLDKAEKSDVELLLIAGDLFHRQPLKRELKELNYRFSQLTHTRIVIVAGNHDYIGTQSFYKDFEWADNVVFFRKNHISYVYIASLNLVVYGMSYDRQEITEAMYDQLRPMRRLKDGRPLPEGCRHILLAHGGDSRHIPINQDKLRQAGFDYVALGHIHKPWIDDRSPMAYAGALEPIDRNDEGIHGYIQGILSEKETKIEFVPFAERSYITLNAEVTPDMTMRQLAESVKGLLGQCGRQNMFQIVIEGFRNVDFELDDGMLMRLGRVLSVRDHSVPDFDFQHLYEENQNNIIGMYIRQISEMDISDELKAKALGYGMKALLETR